MVIGPPYLPAINTLEVSCLVLSWVLFGKGSRVYNCPTNEIEHISRGIVSFPFTILSKPAIYKEININYAI